MLLDADLAILSADPSAYEAYVRGVRGEYAHVDDAAWRVGRGAVLRSLLAPECRYSTATFVGRDARARANLTAELVTLES